MFPHPGSFVSKVVREEERLPALGSVRLFLTKWDVSEFEFFVGLS